MRFLVILLLPLLVSCTIPAPLLDQIKAKGELVVVTRESPTTYYKDAEGTKGLEFEMVEMFATELGVKVKYITADTFDEIQSLLLNKKAHLAAAGLSITEKRKLRVRFTPAYQEITQQLVYRAGNKRPKKITDTKEGIFEVAVGSHHAEILHQLKQQHPELQWDELQDEKSEDLLFLVKEGLIDYTVADSNQVALSRRFHSELLVAFDLNQPQPLAWALTHAEDASLYNATVTYIEKLKKNDILAQMIERYYDHVGRLDFVGKRDFRRHLAKRLPPLIPLFKQASKEMNFDWQLLAAIGYQESHWRPEAVSPTGVKGVMMLTKATAAQLNIKDRIDPEQSISGGARYLRMMEKKIPARVGLPDRVWMALAGYNVGFGHLEDARILTQRAGADPDKWMDVKQYLPLLAQKKYYTTVKYGKARGGEPVHYVDNIRSYYDLLVWHNRGQVPVKKEPPTVLSIMPAAL
ncbi:MAG: membrane-bound lytic murein transglycosylase MltF [Candidatus Sedimenticola sp. (ex Thyasira tokunagai)]